MKNKITIRMGFYAIKTIFNVFKIYYCLLKTNIKKIYITVYSQRNRKNNKYVINHRIIFSEFIYIVKLI